jgi:hypothetical protein
MARLTRHEIEKKLLAGTTVEWHEANGKKSKLSLGDAKERRLFAYLLKSSVRSAANLPQPFISSLSATLQATDDPAQSAATATAPTSPNECWRLQSIETEGFGGLNIWGGPAFH